MRKTLFGSLLFVAVLLFSVACDKSPEIDLPVVNESRLVIRGIIEESDDDDTKVGIIDNVNNFGTVGEKFYWVNGDQIKLLLYPNGDLNATPIEGIFEAVVGTGVRSNDCNFIQVGAPITIPKGSYTAYALYPASGWFKQGAGAWSVGMPSGNTFTQNDASAESLGRYMFKKADAGPIVITSGENVITLPFKIMTSLLRYRIRHEPYESRATAFSKVTLTASSQIFPTTATLSSISDTQLTPGASKTSLLTVNVETSWQSLNGDVDVFVPIFATGAIANTVNFNIALTGTGFRYPLEYNVANVTTQIPSLASGFQASYSYYFNIWHNVWSRSNIVWDAANNRLKFAVTRADNATIPANVQGVFFKWGSLVAIAPSDISAADQQYIAGNYPSGHIIYSPYSISAAKRAWGNLPYLNETSAPFGDTGNLTTDDDFFTYNGGQGFNASTNKGDICRYISAMGWVSGRWRLPTQQELINGNSASDFHGTVVSPSNPMRTGSPSGSNTYGGYHNGFYLVNNGRLTGPNRATVAKEPNFKGSPSSGNFMPFSGQRRYSGGQGSQFEGESLAMEQYGDYFSASSRDRVGTNPIGAMGIKTSHNLQQSSAFIDRTGAHPVRCIRN